MVVSLGMLPRKEPGLQAASQLVDAGHVEVKLGQYASGYYNAFWIPLRRPAEATNTATGSDLGELDLVGTTSET